jgi:hypothetical protein
MIKECRGSSRSRPAHLETGAEADLTNAVIDAAENSLTTTGNSPVGKLRVDMPRLAWPLDRGTRSSRLSGSISRIELTLGLGDKDADLIQEGVDRVVRVGERSGQRHLRRFYAVD